MNQPLDTFQLEIEDAISDVSYGVDKINILTNHPETRLQKCIVILEIQTKENVLLYIRMSLHEGFNVIEYKPLTDTKFTISNEDTRSFDTLANLLLNLSSSFQQLFHQQLFQRLSAIQTRVPSS
ncbi:hypothetical protein DLAC_03515 [Tieghemostelium lacteum]|uniref:GSKIP domain-containing protein n=1 Tax=Tieghemostelium lacteum TaxID=361077 RepID=A0A152A196_TIELA|nr:hypothetical protein DLAC_03515 [Tieghemostelium lacteum]|eukprot:KYR00018.1 hypothetical protein DLAC_03515 [Tieghemostelium lacteum]